MLEAPDAMEAVRLLADRGGIDLLFTDVGLPGGVDGRALADAAQNINPALKVLFTTGYREDGVAQFGLPGSGSISLPSRSACNSSKRRCGTCWIAPAAKEAMVRTESA